MILSAGKPFSVVVSSFTQDRLVPAYVNNQVVALATELVKWYRGHESSRRHTVDPDIAATCANGAGSVQVERDLDGESSDGEMEG